MNFEFATSARIIFGAGKLSEVGRIASGFGTRALMVTGRDVRRAERLAQILREAGIQSALFSAPSEPSVALVSKGASTAREFGAEFVIAFGGGSALDAGKAIAALATNSNDIFEYLEVAGQGKPLSKTTLPFVAIPTTAGTGAEVTRNAVLSVPEQRVKVSLRSVSMLARVAMVDPDLTLDLSPKLTATTGMDALTQLIEPFVCARANPLTDAICREGMHLCARSLKTAYLDGSDLRAREAMSLASLLGGLALANSGLGAVHGFAAAIGGMFPLAHGAICAALLPQVWRANVAAATCEKRDDVLARFREAARILIGRDASMDEASEWLERLVADLGISSLGANGVTREDFPAICEKAARASSMKANPVELSLDELSQILESSF